MCIVLRFLMKKLLFLMQTKTQEPTILRGGNEWRNINMNYYIQESFKVVVCNNSIQSQYKQNSPQQSKWTFESQFIQK